jgi:hypothetical protein
MMMGMQSLMIRFQSSIIDLRSSMALTVPRKTKGQAVRLAFTVVCGGRAAAVSSAFLGDAALADERHLHDATIGSGSAAPNSLAVRRRALHVPARCFVPARRAQQRHASLSEVQQRVVSMQTANEPPQLRDDAGGISAYCER